MEARVTYEDLERRAIREERLAGFVEDYARLCRIEARDGVMVRAPGADGLGAQKVEYHSAEQQAHLENEARRALKWLGMGAESTK